MRNKRWVGNIKNPLLRVPVVLVLFFVAIPLVNLSATLLAIIITTFDLSFWWCRFKDNFNSFSVFTSFKDATIKLKEALRGGE